MASRALKRSKASRAEGKSWISFLSLAFFHLPLGFNLPTVVGLIVNPSQTKGAFGI